MSYIRKIRVEYYQVVSCLKDQANCEDLYDLEELLVKIDQYTLRERTFDYYQEEARLDKLKYNSIDKYWYLNFARLRQTKIPSTAKDDSQTEPLILLDNEYIGEEVTAIYDTNNHIMALQRNRDSLSSVGVEHYLNKALSSDKYEIHLRPIAPLDLDIKLNRAKIYRKLSMKFANIPTSTFNGNRDSSFGRLLDYFNGFSANAAVLTISLGRAKKGTLDDEQVKETIGILRENKGLIANAELNIKEFECDPVDTVDLFSMKSHDFISLKLEKLETIKFEEIADEIHTKYN
ncbi:DUF6731 family protein, partial [Clostridium sp. AM58-1XD]|uniref:DUF6731 family protein n=1 Tax=Clostridium sp. AM58-1XD TaxID=2292307 RepID=UPI000E4D0605